MSSAKVKRFRLSRADGSALGRHALLVLGAFVMTYPLLWMLSSSFKDDTGILGDASLVPRPIDLGNYAEGWSVVGQSFGTFFLNSFVITGLAVVGNLIACSMAAYAFARLRLPFRWFLFAIMLATIMLPFHVIVIPQYILFNELGWTGTILPLVVPKFLAVDAFFIFLIHQFIRSLPRDMEEAAMIDGAGPFRIFWQIVIPLIRPALITVAIFTFMWTWDDFFSQLIYLTNPTQYTVPLGLRLFLDATGQSQFGPMFAMSILAILPMIAIFLFFQRFLVEGIGSTGSKG
jgi:multiple sugar transport system permease protein